MSARPPTVVLRMGSHAEKEYILKTRSFLDGVIIGANLLEATPGATSSLLVKLAGPKPPTVPYLIDPMTYAFGQYVDPGTRQTRTDLEWIKSDQKSKGRSIRDFKRSYRRLASELGDPFETALANSRAIGPSDLGNQTVLRGMCERVATYQRQRIASILSADDVSRDFADLVPGPAAVFAPYFYIEPSASNDLLDLVLACVRSTSQLALDTPVHAVICADVQYLGDDEFLNRLRTELPQTDANAVWLWFSRFYEDRADEDTLRRFRGLIEGLSEHLEVFNMHGGYLSLALSRNGLAGVSHGVGYGEQKDVVPVIGQSTPTVRYYLPALRKRLGVPQIERCFDAMGITEPTGFHDQVCSCVVCKGVVRDSVDQFSSFGDLHYSTPKSKRLAQTPAAARRCRFHFLLARINERDAMKGMSSEDVANALSDARQRWMAHPSVAGECDHLERWERVLTTDG